MAEDRTRAPSGPTWSSWREAYRVVAHRPHLTRTVLTAAVVGTLLFSINQLDVVLATGFTVAITAKAALTYLVPFCVSNAGILIASHRRATGAD